MLKTYIEKIYNKEGGVINMNSSIQKSSFGHALYYPYIHLTNKNWLKHAFLFWDKISRIVPYDFIPNDDKDVLRIKDETNFIEDYHPSIEILEKASSNFKESLNVNAEGSEMYFLEKIYDYNSSDKYFRKKMQKNILNKKNSFHIGKISPSYSKFFEEYGLINRATRNGDWSNHWVEMDSEVFTQYMFILAQTISNEKNLLMLTDNDKGYIHPSTPLLDFSGYYKESLQEKLGYLLIDSIVPKNINNVTMKQLIQIRIKYDDQRLAFFDEINKLSGVLPSIDSKSELEDALNYHNKLLKKQTKELKKVFELNGIESIIKPIAMSMGVSMATEYMIPSENKLLGISVGLAYGVVATYTGIKRRQVENEKNPMSYLLNIQSELDKKSLFQKIQNMKSHF